MINLLSNLALRVVRWEHGPRPLGPKEIDGLLVPPGKASLLLLLVNSSGLSLPRKSGSGQTVHTYKPCWFSWVVMFEALFGCHDVLFWGKSPIKWRQRPDMTISC